MKIAVTHDNGEVFGHFGHTETFKIYEVEGGKIISSAVVPTDGEGHGALADFLRAHGVSALICGGIGGGARMALSSVGIEVFGGCVGSCDERVEDYLSGNLAYDPNARCSHHDHDHHANGHHCGSGGCGSHSCH